MREKKMMSQKIIRKGGKDKLLLKLISGCLVLSILVGLFLSNGIFKSRAYENENKVDSKESKNVKECSKSDDFVIYDENGDLTLNAKTCLEYTDYNESSNEYVVDKKLRNNVDEEIYLSYCEQVNLSNQAIDNLQNSDVDYTIITPEETLEELEYDQADTDYTRAKYKEGVTKLVVKPWGVKVYLSRTALNKGIQCGIGLAGLTFEGKFIQGLLLVLGIAAGDVVPGGIKFDVKWKDMGITALTGPQFLSVNLVRIVGKTVKWQ